MKPITRKELYLNKIVGNDDYDIPEKPITEEEFFFAEILGEAVQAPEPLTRYQIYLAKIAGREIEIPYPEVRLEYFLARAAGMNVETPTPITREEIFWSNYSAIVDFEVEGVPPLTFNAVAGNLKNYLIYGNTENKTRSYSGSAPLSFPITDGSVSTYRIYGNTVNGESVGDLVTDSQSEHYGEYAIPITNNSETANIYLDEPLREVGNEAEYVDYETQKQHRVRKNLLRNTATSRTISGVTITVNDNGSVTCNGTARGNIFFKIGDILTTNQYSILAGCPINGANNSYLMRCYSNNVIIAVDIGSGVSINQIIDGYVEIRIASGYTCDNLTFYPMIRKADIEDDTYEPYIENTEVDVTLPALPSQFSTNSLSVGTTVQPSSVVVDVGEIVSCGDKVTDSQSVNYGKYKIPVTLTAGSAETTDIYLDEPLTKSGSNADYIDYATQKRRNSDGTESSVTLPEIAVTAGVNTLTVGTEVQPSKVYIKGQKERD